MMITGVTQTRVPATKKTRKGKKKKKKKRNGHSTNFSVFRVYKPQTPAAFYITMYIPPQSIPSNGLISHPEPNRSQSISYYGSQVRKTENSGGHQQQKKQKKKR
jgi:hypothetical protein